MMILQVILEGIGLGVLLVLVCAIGIRKGAVGMVHLYSQEVQNRCICSIRYAIRRGSPKCWHTSPSVTVCRNCHLSESE